MRLGSVLYLMGAGLAVQAAVVHFGVGVARRPRDRTHLSFAALAFATAGFLVSTWALHTTTATADYVAVWRGPLFLTGAVALVSAVWFFTFWTGFRPRWPAIALSVAGGAATVVNFATPRGASVSGITRLQQVSFLGEPMALHVGAAEASAVVPALNVALFLYLIVAAADAARRRGLAESVSVLVALAVMLLGATYDLLVDTGLVRTPYLLPLASLAFVAIMGRQLLGEVRATESDLARHNVDLRALVSERTQTLEDVNADLVRRVGQLDRLHEIARVTVTPAQLEAALHQVLSATGALLSAQRAEFTIRPSDDRSPLRLTWTRNGDGVSPSRNGGGGHVLRLPLRSADHTYGSLLAERDAPPFTVEERTVAETVAADVAELVLRDELLAALRHTATLEERSRIARELHESVTQTLYAVAMMAEALPGTLDEDRPSAFQAAGEIRELTLTALAELRALLLELRPERIAAMTLPALLRDEAALVSSRADIAVDVDMDADGGATTETKVAVYRVVRELLSNIARHADATRVSLRLRAREGSGEVTITDDGVGFVPDKVGVGHHGLSIARERLATVGADLQLTSRPGRGTRAVVRWLQSEGRAPPAATDGRAREARDPADVARGVEQAAQ